MKYSADEFRKLADETILNGKVLPVVDALRSAVDEAERLRADNEKLTRERDRWQWCVDEGMRATNFCFPEDWGNEKPYAAFYHAQHLVRQQLEKYMPKDKETPHA